MKAAAIIAVVVLVAGAAYYFFTMQEPGSASPQQFTMPIYNQDLVISGVREIPHGSAADFVVTIKNIGSEAVRKSFMVCMWDDSYIAANPACNNGTIANYDDATMAPKVFPPGGETTVTFESITGLRAGQKVYFVADKSNDPNANAVLEADENNNSFTLVKK